MCSKSLRNCCGLEKIGVNRLIHNALSIDQPRSSRIGGCYSKSRVQWVQKSSDPTAGFFGWPSSFQTVLSWRPVSKVSVSSACSRNGEVSLAARRSDRTPKVEQSALYRERICPKSFGISRSESSETGGLTVGNCFMRSSRCLMWCAARLRSVIS